MATYRLRPRYRGLAWSAIGLGGALTATAWIAPAGVLIIGAAGLILGGGYLLSPTWRLMVVTSPEALAVEGPRGVRFRLPWSEVHKVIASPQTKTCFVDGGVAERRIMVPGDGAPAPYWIERRDELYDEILAAVPADKVDTVALVADRMT